MQTALRPTSVTANRDAVHTQSDFTRRRHEAAVLIPSGPPLGQWVFKLPTSELRGHGVPGAEAVERGIEVVGETDPDFEPRYDSRILEL